MYLINKGNSLNTNTERQKIRAEPLILSQGLKNCKIKGMSYDLELNIRHVFVLGGNNYGSYCFFLTLKEIKGLASYFELCF